MDLQERIDLMVKLGEYLKSNEESWKGIKQKAEAKNSWFTSDFIDLAAKNISNKFLYREKLEKWTAHYHLNNSIAPREVGIVMAGNIPLVGFHDLLSVFICGHRQAIKLSSKDDVITELLVKKLVSWNSKVVNYITIRERLNGCEAYIATGGNQASIHFEKYFQPYPHIIRKSKTSVAVLTGKEKSEELNNLADDIHLYFGRGCRNVTKIYVPEGYDFIPLLAAFDKFSYFSDHHKYKNNYDFQLSLLLLNRMFYMTNGNTLLVENDRLFTPISVLHYSFYTNLEVLKKQLEKTEELQCVIGQQFTPFGAAQQPGLLDYADGVDTMQFLLTL